MADELEMKIKVINDAFLRGIYNGGCLEIMLEVVSCIGHDSSGEIEFDKSMFTRKLGALIKTLLKIQPKSDSDLSVCDCIDSDCTESDCVEKESILKKENKDGTGSGINISESGCTGGGRRSSNFILFDNLKPIDDNQIMNGQNNIKHSYLESDKSLNEYLCGSFTILCLRSMCSNQYNVAEFENFLLNDLNAANYFSVYNEHSVLHRFYTKLVENQTILEDKVFAVVCDMLNEIISDNKQTAESACGVVGIEFAFAALKFIELSKTWFFGGEGKQVFLQLNTLHNKDESYADFINRMVHATTSILMFVIGECPKPNRAWAYFNRIIGMNQSKPDCIDLNASIFCFSKALKKMIAEYPKIAFLLDTVLRSRLFEIAFISNSLLTSDHSLLPRHEILTFLFSTYLQNLFFVSFFA